MEKNYARFDVKTTDPSVSFVVDCEKGEDVLRRARDAVAWWCRATGKPLDATAVAFVGVLRY